MSKSSPTARVLLFLQLLVLVAICSPFVAVKAFTSTTTSHAILSLSKATTTIPSTSSHSASSSRLFAATSEGSTLQQSYAIEIVDGDDRVLDVATFRNGLVNPQMMMERAQAKRDSIDTTKAALDGLKIGLLFVGPAIGIFTYLESNDVIQALTNYGVLGGGLGGILAINNYMGKSVHVPDIPEAKNRIIVDFSEGLLRKQDVGFVAIEEDGNELGSTFEPSRGVMAAVDVQLRNSPQSPSGVRTVPNLPSHLHVKNMEVHKSKRRQGVGQALVDNIINYAKSSTDAKALSLEVEAANPAAVNLYKKVGFVPQKNPNALSKNVFMVKEL